MGYSPRYHFYTSQWPNHHSETDDWAVIEREIKSARESGSTPADYSGYVIDTHTGKRTDFWLKGIVENSDVPAPPEPREPAAREAEKWLLEYPQAIAIRNEWGPDICFYSHQQTIELLEAYSAELRAALKDMTYVAGQTIVEQVRAAKAETRAEAAERSLLQARLILDDPKRKVEYGTPEYFLIQRLRTALASTSAPSSEAAK